jgi:hypothetical protein
MDEPEGWNKSGGMVHLGDTAAIHSMSDSVVHSGSRFRPVHPEGAKGG